MNHAGTQTRILFVLQDLQTGNSVLIIESYQETNHIVEASLLSDKCSSLQIAFVIPNCVVARSAYILNLVRCGTHEICNGQVVPAANYRLSFSLWPNDGKHQEEGRHCDSNPGSRALKTLFPRHSHAEPQRHCQPIKQRNQCIHDENCKGNSLWQRGKLADKDGQETAAYAENQLSGGSYRRGDHIGRHKYGTEQKPASENGNPGVQSPQDSRDERSSYITCGNTPVDVAFIQQICGAKHDGDDGCLTNTSSHITPDERPIKLGHGQKRCCTCHTVKGYRKPYHLGGKCQEQDSSSAKCRVEYVIAEPSKG